MQCARCLQEKNPVDFYSGNTWCRGCIKTIRVLRQVKQQQRISTQSTQQLATVALHVVRQEQATKKSFVYLIRADNGLKIGVSTNISSRMAALQTAHKSPLQLLAVVPGGREQEQELHQKFAKYQVAREWFSAKLALQQEFFALPGALVFVVGYLRQDPST